MGSRSLSAGLRATRMCARMIASVVPHMPCGDKASVLHPQPSDVPALALLLNSVALDALVRLRVGGTQVDYHYARETPLLSSGSVLKGAFDALGLRLNCASQLAAVAWCQSRDFPASTPWKAAWAVTDAARLSLRVTADAMVTLALGLNHEDLRNILSSCDRSNPAGDVKGFWRVDKEKPAELRQTVLTIVVFNDSSPESRPSGRRRAPSTLFSRRTTTPSGYRQRGFVSPTTGWETVPRRADRSSSLLGSAHASTTGSLFRTPMSLGKSATCMRGMCLASRSTHG